MPCNAAGTERGCGVRVKGGLYLETHVAPLGFGTPVDAFIFDPPMPVDMDGLGLSAIGQKLIQAPAGVWHVLDWIGAKHYPNVEDFIREVKAHGLSRRVSRSFDLSVLTKDSRLVLIHPRAIIRNARDYWRAINESLINGVDAVRCLAQERGETDHPQAATLAIASVDEDYPLPLATCSGLWEFDVEGGEPVDEPLLDREMRRQTRKIGDTTYSVPARVDLTVLDGIDGILPAQYAPGYFASFPIGNVALIRDPEDTVAIDALYRKVADVLNGLEVYLEDA